MKRASLILCCTLVLLSSRAPAQLSLTLLEKLIARQHPVPQIRTDSLAARLARGDTSLLLFDVRQPVEYAVSHLPGAIRIDPDLRAADFLEAYGDTLRGRDIVFYCSVGYRSSAFIEHLQKADSATYASIANLRGGIFRWHNEDRPLYADAPVDTVHPYSRLWRHFLKEK